MQVKLDPWAMAAPKWSLDCLALQHVPKGSRGYSSGATTSTTLTPSFSGLLLSEHHIHLQLPGDQRKGSCGRGLRPTQPALAIVLPKQGTRLLP